MMNAVETAIKGPFIIKNADQTVASSTVLANDSVLTLAVVANATYEVNLDLIYGALTGIGIKIGWTAPAGATFNWCAQGLASGVVLSSGIIMMQSQVLADAVSLGSAAAVATNVRAKPFGTLVTAGTAGALQFQWAQAASSGTGTVVRAGSKLTIKRIA